MWSVYWKEIHAFFSSQIGLISIGLFLLLSGLFLWVFPDTSILAYEYAGLDYFFDTTPWIFLFFIPAITMRSFSEEIQYGTIEVLLTKPVSDWSVVFAKFLASWTLVILAIIPTLFYYFSVYRLGDPVGNIDIGATNGSYIGLVLLAGAFSAIGIFASILTRNQISSFLLAVFLCFVFFAGFDLISRIDLFYTKMDYLIEVIGSFSHYQELSRGVIDTKDVAYFLSVMLFFVYLSKLKLSLRQW